MKYLMCLTSMALTACQPTPLELDRLYSRTNSAGYISASWSETSAGATTDFVYRLHIHQNNSTSQIDEKSEILRTNSIVDTTVEWQSSQSLKINCLRGDVYFWINRAIVNDQNIRIELDSQCSEEVRDRWAYIAPSTTKEKIPEIVLADPRVQRLLDLRKNALKPDIGLRVLYNDERTKEVIELHQN